MNNKTINAFLLPERIISRVSQVIDCDKAPEVKYLFYKNFLIHKVKNITTVKDLRAFNMKKEVIAKTRVELSNMNFMHNSHLTESSDLLSAVHDLISVDDTTGTRLSVDPLPTDSIPSNYDFSVFNFNNLVSNINFMINIFILLIFTILTVSLLLFFFCRKNKNKKEEKIELNNIDIEKEAKRNIETNPKVPKIIPDYLNLTETRFINNKFQTFNKKVLTP